MPLSKGKGAARYPMRHRRNIMIIILRRLKRWSENGWTTRTEFLPLLGHFLGPTWRVPVSMQGTRCTLLQPEVLRHDAHRRGYH